MTFERPKVGILLAAGLGSRLGKETRNCPKCLVPLGDTNVLAHWIEKLHDAGVEEIIVNTHYLSNKVKGFIEQHHLKKKISLFHESKLLGTAGTMKALKHRVSHNFFVLHADNFSSVNLTSMSSHFAKLDAGFFGSALTFNARNPVGCGIFELNDKKDKFLSFWEKPKRPKTNIANGATFIFNAKIFSIIETIQTGEDFCNDILPTIYRSLAPYHIKGYHIDIGTPKNLEAARKILLAKSRGQEN